MRGIQKLTQASYEDLVEIAIIESENFYDFDRMLTFEDFKIWFQHNPDIFYVVKDNNNSVLVAVLLVPISKNLHKDIREGKITDLYNFPKKDVMRTFNTRYYHLESVAVTKRIKGLTRNISILQAFKGIATLIIENADFVTSLVISSEGEVMAKKFRFVHISNEINDENSYPIYEGVVTEHERELLRKNFLNK